MARRWRLDGLDIAFFVAALLWIAWWVWIASCITPEEWTLEFLPRSMLQVAGRGFHVAPSLASLGFGLRACGTSILCCTMLLVAGAIGATGRPSRWRDIVQNSVLLLTALPAAMGFLTAVGGFFLLSSPPMLHTESVSEGGFAAGSIAVAFCGALRTPRAPRQ